MIFENVREAPNVHIPAIVLRKLSKKLDKRSPGDFTVGGAKAVAMLGLGDLVTQSQLMLFAMENSFETWGTFKGFRSVCLHITSCPRRACNLKLVILV